MNREKVILVDMNDNELGEMEKLEAHKKGMLHRAFSVFIFNGKGEMLLQQRAAAKYHGSGLWSNTCCSHPGSGEDVLQSAKERLHYEMGLNCDIQFLFPLVYKEEVENGLIEHEFDHVFAGKTETNPLPNTEEVQSFKWAKPEDVMESMHHYPEHYTIWFRKLLRKVLNELKRRGF